MFMIFIKTESIFFYFRLEYDFYTNSFFAIALIYQFLSESFFYNFCLPGINMILGILSRDIWYKSSIWEN